MTEPPQTNYFDLSDSTNIPQVVPFSFNLDSPYPNPFKIETRIAISIPVQSQINLVVQNPLGDIVKVIVSEEVPAGRFSYTWSGENDDAEKVDKGLYFITLESKKRNFIQSRPLIYGKTKP